MTTEVLLSDHGPVRRVALNSPDTFNAMTPTMAAALAEAIEDAPAGDVRALLITGEGAAFSAGANLLAAESTDDFDASVLDAANRITRAVVQSPLPVLAAVNGVAAGFGLSLALAADVVVAAESASFVFAFAKIGLMPDGGATATLAATVGRARAMRWVLLGQTVSAAEARDAGWVAELLPDVDLADRALTVATRLAGGPPLATTAAKRAINRQALADLEGALEMERSAQTALFRTSDFAEGLSAFREGRRPEFTGD